MKLRNYQTTLLESLHTNKFSLIKNSRQMGVSTFLAEFIIETLLEQNKLVITQLFYSQKN
jgi:hypothetical protein